MIEGIEQLYVRRIIDNTKAQQKALDDALVAPKNRLMIRKCNQRLSSTLKSNEPTIQVALDALKFIPFYNAFEVSADVLKFEEPPFEEETLPLIIDLGHTGDIKVLSDVNINHIHQPWRSLAAIINKCLSGKTTGLERLRLSLENKDSKKHNDMFYPLFTKVIVDYFVAKDPSISRRNKMFWHTSRDDSQFTTIRVISKHQDTQIYDANLPQHLTNQAMLESEAYKTYHAYATSEKTLKPKKKKANSKSSPKVKHAPASKGKRLKTSSKAAQSTKEKQPATKSKAKSLTVLSEDKQMKLATKRSQIQTHSSYASGSGDGVDTLSKVPDEQPQKKSGIDERAGDKPKVPDVPKYNSNSEEESWTFSDGDDDDVNEESDTHDDYEEENVEDEEKAEDEEDMSDQRVHTPPDYQLSKESEKQEDDDVEDGEEYGDEEMLYGDLNLNRERIDSGMTTAHATKDTEDANVNLTAVTPVVQQQSPSTSDLVLKFINPSTYEEIPNFASLFGFDQRVTTLESELSILKQSNPFAEAISSIPSIVDKYLATKMKEAVDVVIQLKSDKLREEAQVENQDFINSIDSNMTKIIKQSEVQKNLYNALVEAYNTNKDIILTYGDVVTISRGHGDEEPSARSNRGTKRKRLGKETESTNEPTHKESRTKSSSKGASRSQPTDLDDSTHQEFNTGDDDTVSDQPPQPWITHLVQAAGSQSSFDELMATHIDFSAFMMNRLKIDYLTQELLIGPTYDLIKGTPYPHDLSKPLPLILNTRGHLVILFDHFINNDLKYLKGGSLSHKYTTSITKTKAANYGQIKWIEDRIPRSMWSTDDKLYKFREGDFKRLRRQDIEDMLNLLVQGKLKNLSLDERYALNVALRMYIRRIVIQERVEDLQVAVESYQKKINLSTNRLMRTDELHKFSDGTLNHVRTALNDIATGIQLEYLPKRRWTNQDKKRAQVMINAIDRKLRDRRDYTHFYQLSHSELVDIEKVAVCSSLRSLKAKCTIESRAKRDHP
ncbi:hypothetical protein Tco_0031669 [Tanacetum coccineum]